MSRMFPEYTVPSDVDILCSDIHAFSKHITDKLGDTDFTTRMLKDNCQIDVYENNNLDFKFDLIDSLDEYGLSSKKVLITARKALRRGNEYLVPQDRYELQIRLVEYQKNKKKTWHRDYIIKHGTPGLLFNMEPRSKIQV